MRKIIFMLMLLPLMATAQNTFGYFKYSQVLQQLPQYAQAQADYQELLTRCESEIKRNEQELTRSYVAFLNGQYDFPEPILRKRQKELQDLVDRSIVFREQVKEWLQQAHDSLFMPLNTIIDNAVASVCRHNNLGYAIDCEQAGYKFINPAIGFDITEAVLATISTGEPQRVVATGNAAPVATEQVEVQKDAVATENVKEAEKAVTEDTGGEVEEEDVTNQ